jgi:hypothetical protein
VKTLGRIQHLLEEEITELLRRERSGRRASVGAGEWYCNGYGKPWWLVIMAAAITVRCPRVWD